MFLPHIYDLEDRAWDVACEYFNTDQPTDKQLTRVFQQLLTEFEPDSDKAYDQWAEEQLENNLTE